MWPALLASTLLPAACLLPLAWVWGLAYSRGRPLAVSGFVMLASASALAVALQSLASRRVSRAAPHGLSTADADAHRFLLDLSAGVRAATNVRQLYVQVAGKIAEQFRVENVVLFIRDDATGEFVCAVPPRLAEGERPSVPEDAPHARVALGADAFVVRRLENLTTPLSVGPRSFEQWMKGAPPAARRSRAAEVATLRRIGARLLLPVSSRGRLTGLLALGRRAAVADFSADEKLLLRSVAGQLALLIENSKLLQRMVEEARLRRELSMAAEVQRRLFPDAPPSSRTIELAGYCQPARGVGGDYYDFLTFENGQTGMVVADVAGKGISAALLMSTLQASLRACVLAREPDASARGSLAGLVSTLNRLLCKSTGPASYVTFFYAQLDERSHTLSYVNAGHNPPLLFRAPGAQAALEGGGPVLGIFEGYDYEQGAVQLRCGDVLVGYTDGVVEAMNEQAVEFGERRLREAAALSLHMTAQEICDRIIESVGRWCGGAPQHDDLTLVVLRVKASAG